MHKASTRKRVLMLTGGFGLGGLEMYVLNLVRTAGGRIGFDICSKGSADGDCKALYVQAGAGVLQLPQSRIGFRYFLRLWQLLRRERYDAVCDFTGDLGGLTALAARFAGVRRRLVCYRSALQAFRPTLIRRLYISFSHGLVNRLATAVVSNSFAALDNFFGGCWRKHSEKYFVIRNGICTDLFRMASLDDKLGARRELGLPPDALVVGTVAGLRPEKNLSVIIKILDRFAPC
jgi:glycosyltransferase involved in cell wall biosynthesis